MHRVRHTYDSDTTATSGNDIYGQEKTPNRLKDETLRSRFSQYWVILADDVRSYINNGSFAYNLGVTTPPERDTTTSVLHTDYSKKNCRHRRESKHTKRRRSAEYLYKSNCFSRKRCNLSTCLFETNRSN